ncbi:hypothetical protein H072_582 [Dactylellina haptotyla CBS 200.50]|uniref:non-reducing end alpha-L-arabinofuranosidase n=1 Tax=Dactylellina haptotyla (strain CBS 200.50) TaxID=1284197 RepID=S8AR59_DACHA|nr:hypothetical protein H072_582 [Dactylellina haptotyla CBS 200.50]
MKTISPFLALLLASTAIGASVHLTIPAENGNATSGMLYGLMYEDINYSGDGGLYAELIRNRALQGPNPDLTAWRAYGAGVKLNVDKTEPLSDALPNVIRVDVPATATGKVGFSNEGYWGIPVNTDQYKASFYIKGDYKGDIEVSLRSDVDGMVFATKDVAVRANSQWKKYTTRFTPTSASPNANNTFSILFDADKVAGKSLYFNLISLFPKTWSNSGTNGLRVDLAQAIDDIGGKFLRFPGGNNLEGQSPPYWWKWNVTLGDLIDRPAYPGPWGYVNTLGLGLVEYMRWTDLMDLEPILGVYAGLYLDGTVVPEEDLAPYIQSALDELEFLTGSVDTPWGAVRASLGYPEPWTIKYVEIGNEDNLWGGLPSYQDYRFDLFNNAIRSKYPDITIIASTPEITGTPAGTWLDYHRYDKPDHLTTYFDQFDNWDRNHPVMVGEVAVIAPNEPNKPEVEWTPGALRLAFPSMIGAVAESIFLMGCERNADLVKAVAYAPGFQNLNSYQWVPDMISYTADPADTTLSISYYLQKLFAHNVGDTTVPIVTTANFRPLFWSATYSKQHREYYVKMANYNGTSTDVTLDIPALRGGKATWTTLSAPSGHSYNSPRNITSKWTVTEIPKSGTGWTVTLDNLMIGVLKIQK